MSKASKQWHRILLCLGIVIMLSSVTGFAQLTTGNITGTVTDQSGAAVPGATVILKNTETGVTRTALSGETGKYEAFSLPAGTYEISASLAGFRTATHAGINLAWAGGRGAAGSVAAARGAGRKA